MFTEGVDDQDTECGLDSVQDWNYRIENDGCLSGDALVGELVQQLQL